MKLVDTVARLERAGDTNGKAWQKLRNAIDAFAEHLAKILPGGGQVTKLPTGYSFAHWPSGQYQLTHEDQRRMLKGITREDKETLTMLRLCEDIHRGWLSLVSAQFEDQSVKLEIAAELLNQTRP